MYLNLDASFKPYGGKSNIDFESFTFSGGEPHIKIKTQFEDVEEVTVTHRLKSFEDFGFFLLAVDALKRLKVQKINAFIPYFPAARQDRVMNNGEALTVKIYTNIINSLDLNQITIFDPHSEVTPALLNHCSVVTNHQFIKKVIEDINEDIVLIAPDGGALKKVYQLSKSIGGIEVIECSKLRDTKTGKLSGFKVYHNDLKGKHCLIVDDICDGGGTFLGLAKELKNKNAGDLYLAVSHGIFSKGFNDLKKQFKTIYTTDSFRTIKEEGIRQIELKNEVQ